MQATQQHMPPTVADLPDSAYPSADGKPVADSSEHFDFIENMHGNLDTVLPDFVGADLLIYPVRNNPRDCYAPDVFVAFGRPKGPRKSWLPWNEGGQFPEVVIEGLSPSNTWPEINRKQAWYERHGAKEILVWDIARRQFGAWQRDVGWVDASEGYTSPLLGCRFEVVDDQLRVTDPSGAPFKSRAELRAEAEAAKADASAARDEANAARDAANAARDAANAARDAANAARDEANAERLRREALEARLRALGIDPNV